MTEETIFAAALERQTPAERAAYLDAACGGDAELRRRVEALLRSHEDAQFLHTPAVQRVAEALAGPPDPAATQGPAAGAEDEVTLLGLLAPSERPGALGRLGHYEVLEVIGRGGMGVVLRAFDEKLHRVVAIKVMAAQLAATSPPRRRFLREARAAAAVRHENVVAIHAVEEQPVPHLVMEYVPGETLQQRLDRLGPLETAEVLRIGRQVARGLAAAHAQGLVHRDVKPANVLLEGGLDGRAKLTDFGLARAADDASLTQSGVIAGTPLYMAPEQAQGEAIDQRADLFSLGSLLYTMCAGRPPFRAATSVAVLKRVTEDTPRPIRDIIPEVPEWLCAIIARLHAKKPEDRFQSAAEVADLLDRCQAELELRGRVEEVPGLPPAAVAPAPAAPARVRPASRRRWLAAAAVLLSLFGGLGFTEATGVTRLVPTVIRVLTPDGTLVVEASDPDVKVTVEGDGGLVIAGPGPQEVRLRPGSYQVKATKDGKPVPLDRDLVAISRGGREVVRVRVEGAAPAPALPPAERRAFVVLGGQGAAERKFDTLTEAVADAEDGGIIEVRGNGPFATRSVRIRRGLTVRAGPGFRPSIVFAPDALSSPYLIEVDGPLTLEGLELLDTKADRPREEGHWLVWARGPSLRLLNCRLVLVGSAECVAAHTAALTARNCEVLSVGAWDGIDWDASAGDCVFDNCLFLGRPVFLGSDRLDRTSLRLTRNTFVTNFQALTCNFTEIPALSKPPAGRPQVRVDADENVFALQSVFHWQQHAGPYWKPVRGAEAEALFARLIDWKERRNVYARGASSIGWSIDDWGGWKTHGPRNLAEWDRFWKQTGTGSIEGRVAFQGGDILGRLAAAPEKLAPADVRLRPDSAGYKAGPGGRDLGADVELVGPGPAYERWKRTPDYQQWLKETTPPNRRSEAAPSRRSEAAPEPGAFVVGGGKGVAERKFDKLAEAVARASDGDTIEVRGNGPFDTGPAAVNGIRLTIRAGAGFRPVIRESDAAAQARPVTLAFGTRTYLLRAVRARLVLEGLEFQMETVRHPSSAPCFLLAERCPSVHAANCRFVATSPIGALGIYPAGERIELVARNCQFVCGTEGAVATCGEVQPKGPAAEPNRRVFDNCLCAGLDLIVDGHNYDERRPADPGTGYRLTRSTFVAARSVIQICPAFPAPADRAEPPSRVHASANVFDAPNALNLVHFPHFDKALGKEPSGPNLEAVTPGLVAWDGGGNLFRPGGRVVEWGGKTPEKHLTGLDRLWPRPAAKDAEGTIRFRGGNLLARLESDPAGITPDDFRLREDSAGYRAGKDGKDLGADVDLVGPGAAYERWKKTPDYQRWLKETGQAR